ncbi:MAG: DUF58 domain-containing protein [Planctomycetales bacterium]|nr:DUF58 domain-containing protein [Planctomycetales bacterium]
MMSNAQPTLPSSKKSVLASWGKSLSLSRKRERTRALSQVHFRLTKEGVHFVGVLLFIFFGAVLRDISLLILMAGSMIGLLVLQWRFNSRTLVGLRVSRRIPKRTSVGKETDVSLSVFNPKRWLGSWLVLAEDPITQILPVRRKTPQKGSAIINEVRPRGMSGSRYQIQFRQRGEYVVGPTTISTRFPIGLGRGWRTLDNAANIIVHPELGALTPAARKLFQEDLQGHTQASSKSGTNEAEFYGLRSWTTGDSRRWIHWRTTAKLGQLMVRQFERQQHHQACILIDLFMDKAAVSTADEQSESVLNCELAIQFLATLAHSFVLRRRDKLTVAIAAEQNQIMSGIQSAVMLDNLLDQLATVTPSGKPALLEAVQGISLPLMANPNLLVISTRQNQLSDLQLQEKSTSQSRLLSRLKVRWLDVASGDLKRYFESDGLDSRTGNRDGHYQG